MSIITNILPQRPAAKIIVDGLFILCVNEQTRTAQLGVYEYANEHDFFIRVSQKDHDSNSELLKHGVLVRKLDDKHEIETGDISISISNRLADVSCYQHAAVTDDILKTDPKIDPNSEKRFERLGYTTDFRWVIDLEGKRFHKNKLEVVPGVIGRKVSIPHGVLYTENWAARKLTAAYHRAAKMAGIEIPPHCLYVANQLGIAIESLSKDETIDIEYDSEGERKTLSLSSSKAGPSIYYEILISNNCPASVAEKKNKQRDFQHYYNVVNVPVAERFELDRVDGAGSSIVPCDLIFLGQTPQLPEEKSNGNNNRG